MDTDTQTMARTHQIHLTSTRTNNWYSASIAQAERCADISDVDRMWIFAHQNTISNFRTNKCIHSHLSTRPHTPPQTIRKISFRSTYTDTHRLKRIHFQHDEIANRRPTHCNRKFAVDQSPAKVFMWMCIWFVNRFSLSHIYIYLMRVACEGYRQIRSMANDPCNDTHAHTQTQIITTNRNYQSFII